jgi:hypothetical protein
MNIKCFFKIDEQWAESAIVSQRPNTIAPLTLSTNAIEERTVSAPTEHLSRSMHAKEARTAYRSPNRGIDVRERLRESTSITTIINCEYYRPLINRDEAAIMLDECRYGGHYRLATDAADECSCDRSISLYSKNKDIEMRAHSVIVTTNRAAPVHLDTNASKSTSINYDRWFECDSAKPSSINISAIRAAPNYGVNARLNVHESTDIEQITNCQYARIASRHEIDRVCNEKRNGGRYRLDTNASSETEINNNQPILVAATQQLASILSLRAANSIGGCTLRTCGAEDVSIYADKANYNKPSAAQSTETLKTTANIGVPISNRFAESRECYENTAVVLRAMVATGDTERKLPESRHGGRLVFSSVAAGELSIDIDSKFERISHKDHIQSIRQTARICDGAPFSFDCHQSQEEHFVSRWAFAGGAGDTPTALSTTTTINVARNGGRVESAKILESTELSSVDIVSLVRTAASARCETTFSDRRYGGRVEFVSASAQSTDIDLIDNNLKKVPKTSPDDKCSTIRVCARNYCDDGQPMIVLNIRESEDVTLHIQAAFKQHSDEQRADTIVRLSTKIAGAQFATRASEQAEFNVELSYNRQPDAAAMTRTEIEHPPAGEIVFDVVELDISRRLIEVETTTLVACNTFEISDEAHVHLFISTTDTAAQTAIRADVLLADDDRKKARNSKCEAAMPRRDVADAISLTCPATVDMVVQPAIGAQLLVVEEEEVQTKSPGEKR